MNLMKFTNHRKSHLKAMLAICLLTLNLQASWPKPIFGSSMAASAEGNKPAANDSAKKALIQENYGKLPLSFEANQGQTSARVKFLSRGQDYTFFLTANEAVMELRKADFGSRSMGSAQNSLDAPPELRAPQSTQQSATLRMKLAGANQNLRITGAGELPGRSNYFLGSDANGWKTDVPNYARVKYEGVYPGIDVIYYGNQQQLEYDFRLAPGADPKRIKLSFAGARKLRLDEQGDLLIETTAGKVRQHRPVVYQKIGGRRQQVVGAYLLRGKNEVAFGVGAYDASRPLVIDPVLSYSTYLGATSNGGAGHGEAIAVDAQGNAYITGYGGGEFPTTPGAVRQTNPAPSAQFVFVVKLDPTGSTALYSALIGGTNGFYVSNGADSNPILYLDNRAYGIAVDPQGNAYVTGETTTANFPTTPNAFQRTIAPGTDDRHPPTDAFVIKLNASGNALAYATLLSGVGSDKSFAIAVNASGEAWITGVSSGNGYPTTLNAYQQLSKGGAPVIVTKLNATGSALLYSTYLGGTFSPTEGTAGGVGSGIALDAQGNAYVTGRNFGTSFPLTPGVYHAPGYVFVTKFSAAGVLAYSTTLGVAPFSNWDQHIAVDAQGNAYIAGACEWEKFPTTPGAFQPTGGSPNRDFPNTDGFVVKLNPNATALVYATYFGSLDDREVIRGIAVDAAGSAYVTGYAFSPRFPVTSDSYRPVATGKGAFVTKFNPAGTGLIYSTMIGNNDSRAYGIALDPVGNAYITGGARFGYATTPGSYQPHYEGLTELPPGSGKGYNHAFATKIAAAPNAEPLIPSPLPVPTPIPRPSTYEIAAKALDANGYAIPSVEFSCMGTASGTRGYIIGGILFGDLPSGGNYVITATLPGRTFSPPSFTINNLSESQTVLFTLVALPGDKFQISGYLTDDNNVGLSGAKVGLSGGRTATATTNSQGFYSFQDLPGGGNYTVSPAKQGGLDFVPRSQTFTNLSTNQSAHFKRSPLPQPLANLSAASYDSTRFAADSIVTAFGAKLAVETQVAASMPLPVYLVGTTVIIRDSRSEEYFAPLFFVSPTQVNYLIPPEVAPGLATVVITSGDGMTSGSGLQIEATAPGLFTADASGRGLLAGVALRVKANGAQSYEPIARFDAMQNKLVPIPIDLGAATEQVYLISFGTGVRNRSAMTAVSAQFGGVSTQVIFAGAQGEFAGLDQVNLLLPRALAGRGEVDFTLSVEGKPANPVKVWIK